MGARHYPLSIQFSNIDFPGAKRQMQKVAKRLASGIVAALIASGLAGCAKEIAKEQLTAGILPPVINPVTEINQSLRDLPPPSQKVVVAVYNYADQTGQFKPSEATQSLSRAVTKGRHRS